MTLEWLSVGTGAMMQSVVEDRRGRTLDDYRVEAQAAIAELRWVTPDEHGVITGPMSPVLFINETIKTLGLAPVTAVALGHTELVYPDGPEWASYTVHGIEVTGAKQHFRLYVLDRGVDGVPLAVDWNPTGATS